MSEVRRAEFSAQFGHMHNETGVDMQRARDFMGALGLHPLADVLIVSDDNHRQIIEQSSDPLTRTRGPGIYEPSIHTAIINRDHNRPNQIATTVVHELGGHATTRFMHTDDIMAIKRLERRYGLESLPIIGLRDIDPRTGIITGSFLDEGRADWIALEHRRATGAIDPAQANSADGIKYSGPPTVYNPAATAFDVLFAKDPGLIEPVLQSGVSIDAAQEVVVRLERIRPGLYADLAAVPLTGGTGAQHSADIVAFSRGLQTVLEATGFTDADIRDIANHGPGAQYVADRLQRQAVVEGRVPDWYPYGRP
jgi:hypothetical protein